MLLTIDLNHGLANSCAGFFDLSYELGIVEDSARHLAMSSSETKDQMKSGFLNNIESSTLTVASRLKDQLHLPFECCSQKACGHPQAAFQRKSDVVDRVGFLPVLVVRRGERIRGGLQMERSIAG